MSKGTLMLNTDVASRKMSYLEVDGKFYMSTNSTSNKVAQIKINNQVTTDLDGNKHIAKLVAKGDENFNEIKKMYLSAMPKFQKLLYKCLFGRKHDMFIVFE